MDELARKISIKELKGLGPKSETWLSEVGIFTRDDLNKIGAVQAFIKLKEKHSINPSLTFLYAMVGALENRHWVDIAQTEKLRLLMELDGYQQLEEVLLLESVNTEV